MPGVAAALATVVSFCAPTVDGHPCGRFPGLLRELEARRGAVGVRSYGVSVTTMEEVFLHVSRRAAAQSAAAAAAAEKPLADAADGQHEVGTDWIHLTFGLKDNGWWIWDGGFSAGAILQGLCAVGRAQIQPWPSETALSMTVVSDCIGVARAQLPQGTACTDSAAKAGGGRLSSRASRPPVTSCRKSRTSPPLTTQVHLRGSAACTNVQTSTCAVMSHRGMAARCASCFGCLHAWRIGVLSLAGACMAQLEPVRLPGGITSTSHLLSCRQTCYAG